LRDGDVNEAFVETLLLSGAKEAVEHLRLRLLVEPSDGPARPLNETEWSALLQALEAREALVARQQQLAILGQLAAGTAHEVRNVLTTLRGAAQVALVTDGPEGKQLLRQVEQQTSRAATLLAELMRAAAPERIHASVTNVPPLVREICDLLAEHARRHNAALVYRLEQEPLKAADRGYHIRQILTNLVINAISTGHAGTIEISAVRDESSIRVLVRDQGPGIPADIQERICGSRFARVTEAARGAALALAVSAR
jgi:signal transduction histidine kinase